MFYISIKIFRLILFSTILIIFYSCSEDESLNPELEQTADYLLTFESSWSNATHPTNFPQNPHFSGLVGAVHNQNVEFWREGENASIGIKEVAEWGRKDSLISEVEQAIQATQALSVLSGSGLSTSPSSRIISIQVNRNYSYVTVVSMLAPSPDWFVGVSSLNMFRDGEWIDNISIELFAYDAGTDSGENYTSPNQTTNPPENISKIDTSPFKVNETITSVGRFNFVRIN
jgi:hypothetical protein